MARPGRPPKMEPTPRHAVAIIVDEPDTGLLDALGVRLQEAATRVAKDTDTGVTVIAGDPATVSAMLAAVE